MFLNVFLLTSPVPSPLLAQGEVVDGWGEIVSTYGPFAPFAIFLLFVVNQLWKDNKDKESEIRKLTDTTMEKVLPVLLDATTTLKEAAEVLTRTNMTNADINRLQDHMDELSDQLLALRKDISRGDRQ